MKRTKETICLALLVKGHPTKPYSQSFILANLQRIHNILSFSLNMVLLFNHFQCLFYFYSRSRRLEVFCKNSILRNFARLTLKHLGQSLFFNKICRPEICNFILKRRKICEIFKNIFFHRTCPSGGSFCYSLNEKTEFANEIGELC